MKLLDFVQVLENTTFRKLDLFQSSNEERETPTLLCPVERAVLNHWTTHVEIEVNLRPTVSRPICPGVRLRFGAHDEIFVFCLIMTGFLM
jgi:hypothetical protein